MRRRWFEFWHDEEGQDLAEYALVLVLIALLALASVKLIAHAVGKFFSNSTANVTPS